MTLPQLGDTVADVLRRMLPAGRETVPIERARRHLLDKLPDGGSMCPVCGQHAQLYRRRLHATMARDLVAAYERHGIGRFFQARTISGGGGDFAKLAMWGLIAARTDDEGRVIVGEWRVTDAGASFVTRRSRVLSHALVYNGVCVGLDGDPLKIDDALGRSFRLDGLLSESRTPASAEAGRTAPVTRPHIPTAAQTTIPMPADAGAPTSPEEGTR